MPARLPLWTAPATSAGRRGTDGLFNWVEGAPRGPLIGQSIASVGDGGPFGIDGQAAGAFDRRDAFRDARFSVAGDRARRGATGGFRACPSSIRRAAASSAIAAPRGARASTRIARQLPAASPVIGLFGTDIPAESLRQLTHELRTPLNAIVGFADMIEGQYMGPAGAGYRLRANQIKEQAERLLTAIDDLDTAARIETNRLHARRELGRCRRAAGPAAAGLRTARRRARRAAGDRDRATRCRRRRSRPTAPSG